MHECLFAKDNKVSETIYDEVIKLLKQFNNPLYFIKSDVEIDLDDLVVELDTRDANLMKEMIIDQH